MEILEKGTNIIKNKFNSECGYFFQARKVTSWNITKFHFLTGGGEVIKILLLVKAIHDDTMRHRSAILVLFIILKDLEIFSGANLKPCMIAYFYIYFENL